MLSDPVERELSHTRNITCKGYLRHDNNWDIEAEMQDLKNYSFANEDRGGTVHKGEKLHNMFVRLTIDADMCIIDAEAFTKYSPYAICPDICDHYKKLIGLKIAPGWTREIKNLFSGVHGCTHITELLGTMATIAFQTIFADKARLKMQDDKGKSKNNNDGDDLPDVPPLHLNTCHALRLDGDVVKRDYPDHYKKT